MYTELCEVDDDFLLILALVSAKLCCFLFFVVFLFVTFLLTIYLFQR